MTGSIFDLNNYFFNPHSLADFIPGITIMAQSIFVFLQNRKSGVNISFALATFSAGMWLTGIGLMYCSTNAAIAFIWCRYYCWLGIIFITPYVYLFSSTWGRIPLNKNAKFLSFSFIPAIIFYIFCISTYYIIQGVWLNPWGFYPHAGRGEIILIIWFYILMIFSFRNFIKSYREEKISIRKKQTLFIIIAFVLGFLGSLDFLGNYGVPLYSVGGIFALIFSTTMAYAIVNYKLMEIETAIHKTIAWFLTSIALVAPLAALLYFTRHWYMRLNAFSLFGYLAAVLLLFLFFVKFFQPKVDNLFQRGRAYIENVLNKFSDELVHLRNLEGLIDKISDTIIRTINVSKVTILLYSERVKKLVNIGSVGDSLRVNIELDSETPFLKWLCGADRIVNSKFIEIDPRYEVIRSQAKEYFKGLGADLCIPLVLNDKLIGIINLGHKTNLKPFNSLDYHFLARLKTQSTIAISNSLVYDRVEELVRIRTEELIRTQRQLIQAEKLATVGTLAGGVAHEINNPLAAILTNAQMLSMAEENEENKESIKWIEDAAKRCRSIVQKLMVYSRKPLGGRDVIDVDLEKALNNALSLLSYQLTQENIKVNTRLTNAPFIIHGSQNELEQVFTNLLLNAKDAIKHKKKSGQIDISITRQDKQIIIKVKDDGIGISKEHISKIFDPFYTTKDVGKGTGLGLSICHSIIEGHKGAIRVESQEGEGSTFIVNLPAQKSA
jgi:signal transduction histidine kinase